MLVNFRADPDVIRRVLPAGFRPKLHRGKAIAGVCLIRLEHIRPKHLPEFIGINSENAAHRIAVEWTEGDHEREGVFIPRRDTDSTINTAVGGRLFPGEHHLAEFSITENGEAIDFSMRSRDGDVAVDLKGKAVDELPKTSIFGGVEEASSFFEKGSLGYSSTRDQNTLDGIVLETKTWKVRPLLLESLHTSYYDDRSIFPEGSVEFDHALIMHNIEHEWHSAASFDLEK